VVNPTEGKPGADAPPSSGHGLEEEDPMADSRPSARRSRRVHVERDGLRVPFREIPLSGDEPSTADVTATAES
jgi:hypothetical protein